MWCRWLVSPICFSFWIWGNLHWQSEIKNYLSTGNLHLYPSFLWWESAPPWNSVFDIHFCWFSSGTCFFIEEIHGITSNLCSDFDFCFRNEPFEILTGQKACHIYKVLSIEFYDIDRFLSNESDCTATFKTYLLEHGEFVFELNTRSCKKWINLKVSS